MENTKEISQAKNAAFKTRRTSNGGKNENVEEDDKDRCLGRGLPGFYHCYTPRNTPVFCRRFTTYASNGI